jgi:hypothetical protein
MVLRQKLTNRALERIAPFYKYTDKPIPESFLDTKDVINYLRYSNDKQLLIKIELVKKMLREKYFDTKKELYFIEWVEDKEKSGWFFDYCVPNYRMKFDDPHKQDVYSKKQVRYHKMTNQTRQLEAYHKLKERYAKGSPIKIPPIMASLRRWRDYFALVTSLEELTKLDKCIADILNGYEKERKEVNTSRDRAVKYLEYRKHNPKPDSNEEIE